MEKQPSFSRFVGGSSEQIATLKQETEKASLLSGDEFFGEELLIPTEEEKRLIGIAVAYANGIAARYGSSRTVHPERVFLLQEGGVERLTDGKIAGGINNRFSQIIGVEKKVSPIFFAMTVVHEACHGASYSSAQVKEDGSNLPYRSGIAMRELSGPSFYFKKAEEAIVTMMAQRFHDEVLTYDSLYKDEIARLNEIKTWLCAYSKQKFPVEKHNNLLQFIDDIVALPNNEDLYEVIIDDSYDNDYKFGYFYGGYKEMIESDHVLRERREERLAFDAIVQRIVQQSGGTVMKDELFDDFARAHFSGNYLPLARKIEKILGTGSFRSIAAELGEVYVEEGG